MGDAGSGDESAVEPTTNTSGWSFHWPGLVAVIVILVFAFVGWQWLGGSDDDPSNQIASREATETTEGTARASSTTRAPTTTRPATTTTVPATTTTVPGEREVIISGEMKACRFGANCLVASFRIDGFDPHPGRFICIYPNSQSDFSFNNTEVFDACITADQGDTITIEVDGIQSATISEENLDGG